MVGGELQRLVITAWLCIRSSNALTYTPRVDERRSEFLQSGRLLIIRPHSCYLKASYLRGGGVKNRKKRETSIINSLFLPTHGFVGSSDYFLYFCLFYPATLRDTSGKKALFILVTGKNKNLTATHDQTAAREKGMSEGGRKKREREKHTHQFFMASRCSWTEKRGREVNGRNGGRFFPPQCRKSGPFFFRCPRMLTKLHQEGQTEGFFFFSIDPQLLLQGSSACFKLVKSTVHWIQASAFDYLWCYGNHRSANREKRSSFVQVTRSQELAYMCVPCKMQYMPLTPSAYAFQIYIIRLIECAL